MYILLTKNFRGKFPVDAGGVTFADYGVREVGDEYGRRMCAAQPNIVVECDAKGNPKKPIVDLHAVVSEPAVDPQVDPSTETEPTVTETVEAEPAEPEVEEQAPTSVPKVERTTGKHRRNG